MYVSKASERLILENERPLHDEVMSNMGNLWFALLPKIPQVSPESLVACEIFGDVHVFIER
jgi:hypothetical protein